MFHVESSRVTTGLISGSEVRLDFCLMPGEIYQKGIMKR